MNEAQIREHAAEIGYTGGTLPKLRDELENLAASWNGDNDRKYPFEGEMVSPEAAQLAAELVEAIDILV